MKVRSGFVSNSSSSSFVFVGFPKSQADEKTVNKKEWVQSEISKRELDKYAANVLQDCDYEDYCNGDATDAFWNSAYENFHEVYEDDAPDGYDSQEIKDEQWYGINIAEVYEGGYQSFDMIKIDNAIKKIKKDFPNAKPILVATGQ